MRGPDQKRMKSIIQDLGIEQGMRKITQLIWIEYLKENAMNCEAQLKDAQDELEKIGQYDPLAEQQGGYDDTMSFGVLGEGRNEEETASEYIARVRAKK